MHKNCLGQKQLNINFLMVMCIQLHIDMHTIICNINLHLLSAVVSIS